MRKWANSRQTRSTDSIQDIKDASSSDPDFKGHLDKYMENGNPFDKAVEEEETEDVFSGVRNLTVYVM